ncbi:hypothetical protein G9A89_011296 [Geosiphon pyriformis]|nr:hypothetical protein G9A89_011296 [Geosiphon pyriformis]
MQVNYSSDHHSSEHLAVILSSMRASNDKKCLLKPDDISQAVCAYNTTLDSQVADESTNEPTNELNKYRMQDIKPSSLITLDDWKNQLRNWEQILIDEEIARLENEKAERDNNGNMKGQNGN